MGVEQPWEIGEFLRKQLLLQPEGSDSPRKGRGDRDEVIVADLGPGRDSRGAQTPGSSYRDRRPDSYGELTAP